MHSTYLLTALAAFTALTSAHPSYPAPAVVNHPPSLVDLDVAAIVPILNNADVEVLDLEKRRAMNTDKGDLSNDGLVLVSVLDDFISDMPSS